MSKKLTFRAARSTAEKSLLLQTITPHHLDEALAMDPAHQKQPGEDPYESIMPMIYDFHKVPRVLLKDPSVKPWAAESIPSTPPF